MNLTSRPLQFWSIFLAIVAIGTALGGALAHLFELPNKIGMDRDTYFAVQAIYNGWNQIAYVLALELLALIAGIVATWRMPKVRNPLIGAVVFFFASQIIFWTFTAPANVATENWTQIPPNWEAVRARWEYSHAAGAVCQFIALLFATLAALHYPVASDET